MNPITENERWLLSFYRTSEISGALFFGRLARALKPGPIQHDLTKHFSDESMHSWYWTDCLKRVGAEPMKLDQAYQDQYISAAGMPTNIMEILGITLIFEKRVIGQYALHRQASEIRPEVRETLDKIVDDEKWHIHWVTKALEGMHAEYGKEHIQATLKKYHDADVEVYQKTMKEHGERVEALMKNRR
ncbi:MAG TPA: ferritin-like domain-containing protein [Bdellovibrionota bacterium]|nr:ferritin-like domain-containing protein [Bdellovibrionota bacterium]